MNSLVHFIVMLNLITNVVWANETTKENAVMLPEMKIVDIPDQREFPLNEQFKPCDDFYGYVCSKVIEDFQLPEDRSAWIFSFHDSRERMLNVKKKFFANLATREIEKKNNLKKDQKTVQETVQKTALMLKNYYLSCLDSNARAEEEKKILQEKWNEISKLRSHKEIQEFLSNRAFTEEPTFVGAWNSDNQTNPDIYDLSFSTSLQTLPERSYYENKKLLESFESIMRDFFLLLNIKDAKKVAKNLVSLEKEFAQTYPLPADFRDIWTDPNTYISRDEIVTKYPALGLDKWLQKIPTETKTRHMTTKSLEWLNNNLQKLDLATLKYLMMWNFYHEIVEESYPAFRNKYFQFEHDFLGEPKERPNLQERCTTSMMSTFTMEVDKLLYPEVFGDFPEKRFQRLVEKVRSSLLSQLEKNSWLTKEGKKEAMKKMKKAKLYLVKPQNPRQWDIEEAVEMEANKFLENNRRLAKRRNSRKLRKLKEGVNKESWGMGPLTVNAYYSASANKFVIPAGILQYPFFSKEMTDEQILGSIGVVIGHELGHGIDDMGSQFDSEGKLRAWLNESDLEEFKKRSALLKDDLKLSGHNPELTIGEAIGDFVGVRSALGALLKPNKKLSDHDKSRARDFFIQFGRVWCGKLLPKARESRLKTDPHALGEVRTNVTLQHIPEFQEAFNCDSKDKMVKPRHEQMILW